jgi:pimeloyl-ACP methyl ester carboxylesterase
MDPKTIAAEVAAIGGILASYPLDWIARRAEPYVCTRSSEPVIMVHGMGGSRANLLGLATYLRLASFDNISYFEYSRWQALGDSAAQLGRIVEQCDEGGGVHLVGYSLGGTIARLYAVGASRGRVRSLVSLGSPYSLAQYSPREVAIFGDQDPIVPAPLKVLTSPFAFGRLEILQNVGHLALLYHPEVLRIVGTELRANRAVEAARAA